MWAWDQFAVPSCGLSPKLLSYLSLFLVSFPLVIPLLDSRIKWLCGHIFVGIWIEFRYWCLIYLHHGAPVVFHLQRLEYLLGVHVHHLYLMLPQCMLICPWEGKFCLHFCSWQFFRYHFSKFFLCYFPNYYDIPQVLQRRRFQWWEYYIQGAAYIGIWYPQNFKNLRVAWLDQHSSFTCFTNIPFSVSMALNLWKVEMISEPSRYLLLILGFYQRSVLLFLYVLQCCCYLKDLTIENMVSCCSCVGGIRSMDNRHYSVNNIFMAHGDYNTEVELESLHETGLGGLQWWKPLKRADMSG